MQGAWTTINAWVAIARAPAHCSAVSALHTHALHLQLRSVCSRGANGSGRSVPNKLMHECHPEAGDPFLIIRMHECLQSHRGSHPIVQEVARAVFGSVLDEGSSAAALSRSS
eukprot:1042454-Pelagomonas_calceolata.AAC.3